MKLDEAAKIAKIVKKISQFEEALSHENFIRRTPVYGQNLYRIPFAEIPVNKNIHEAWGAAFSAFNDVMRKALICELDKLYKELGEPRKENRSIFKYLFRRGKK